MVKNQAFQSRSEAPMLAKKMITNQTKSVLVTKNKEKTFYAAAIHGSLINLKWLREEGCPWDEDTFTFAAIHGSLINLKWLREEGCPEW